MSPVVLNDLCEMIVDCEHKTAEPSANGPYPLIRTPDIGLGVLLIDGAQRIDEDAYRAWTKRAIPRSGDLILAREAPVGNVGIVPPGIEPVLGQRTVLIRTDPDKLSPGYLNYLLSAPPLRGWMHGVSIGATVPHLNMADIRAMPMPKLPPVRTQGKIAAILAVYDDLIENNNRRIKILEEMAQRIYREWFVDFRYPGHENPPLVDSELGPIPQGWAVVAIDNVCNRIQSGGTPSRSNDSFWSDGTVDWYTTRELQDAFVFSSAERIAVSAIEAGKTRVFAEGTILLAIYGASIGRLGVLTTSASCNQAALALVPNRSLITEIWLYHQLLVMRDHFKAISQGAAQQNISREKVAGARIVLPIPSAVVAFDHAVRPLWDLIKALSGKVRVLQETRNLLLPRLISGDIDVTNLDVAVPEVAA